MNFKLILLSLILFSSQAMAKLNVITTFAEFAELARDIGGKHVLVESLLEGTEDVHHQDALPSHILKLKKADVLCFAGLDLEIGWLPRLIMKSSNAKIIAGAKGYCEIGNYITPLEKPKGIIDRSFGDVHAGGNPHYNLGIDSLIEAANYITKVLAMNAPKHADEFQQNLKNVTIRLTNLKSELKLMIKKPLKAMHYHQEFSYFFANFGIEHMGSIEEKPGVPPSASRILVVSQLAKKNKVDVTLASYFAPEKVLTRFKEISLVKTFKVPTAVIKNNSKLDTIEKVQRHLIKTITQ
jgi:zinc/manganese transport system substrate-binding protein